MAMWWIIGIGVLVAIAAFVGWQEYKIRKEPWGGNPHF